MSIENSNLTLVEKNWLEAMLSENFLCREKLLKQINHAKVVREYARFYILIRFKVSRTIAPIKCGTRVPVEMRLRKPDCVPTQFLLHVIDGYLSELEVFNADSSEISPNLEVGTYEKEIIIEEQAK